MIKNIILTSAVEDKNYKGIVSLENTTEKTLVSLKTYNLPKTENKRVLGVLIDGDLYKVSLNNNDSYLIDKKTNLNNKISIVLLEIENNLSKILIWGSNETSRVWKNSIIDNFDEVKINNTQTFSNNDNNNNLIIDNNIYNKEDDINKYKIYNQQTELEDEYESEEYIENLIDENLDKELLEEDIKENLKEDKTDNKSEFFSSIESQIEELLNNYEEEKALEEIIPSSKFVKVDLENNGNFYVFGVIYEGKDIKYIVYGLPGEYSVKPDDEYSKFYQWLPLNYENPEGYGYYLMYQDAISGSQIEMIID